MTTVVPAAAVTQLRADICGTVLAHGDADFESARQLFNGAITTQPALIVQVTGVADIRAALAFARQWELDLAVRSGGHSVAGSSLVEDGLVIDMRAMNWVDVDSVGRTVTVGGGAVWGDVDAATEAYGLVTTGGRVSSTGVAGMTLGGGSGWLERKFGLASDNLLSAELVTADGVLITTDASHHPELFWGLHGGGGNFGIVVSLTFRLYPLPEFSAAVLLWPASAGPAVARCYRDFIDQDAPDEIGGGLLFTGCPNASFAPEYLLGTLCCVVLVTYVGPVDELRDHIEPLMQQHPWGQLIGDMPYTELQRLLDDEPGYRHYWSGDYLHAVPDAALDIFCAHASGMPAELTSRQLLVPWGGAVARSTQGALANRDTPWVLHPLGQWTNQADDEQGRQWARGVVEALAEWTSGATYLNFIPDEGHDRVVAGFGADNYQRLSKLKAHYDPHNVFHRWHNVPPDTTELE